MTAVVLLTLVVHADVDSDLKYEYRAMGLRPGVRPTVFLPHDSFFGDEGLTPTKGPEVRTTDLNSCVPQT